MALAALTLDLSEFYFDGFSFPFAIKYLTIFT